MTILSLILGALMVTSNLDRPEDDLTGWNNFKVLHNKVYENQQVDAMRHRIFLQSKDRIEKFNAQNGTTFKLAVNKFSDRKSEEISRLYGVRMPKQMESMQNSLEEQSFLDSIMEDTSFESPASVDWRKEAGRVSRVKDQGDCGSCWAFATIGVLEGQEVVRNRSSLVELSEQNLVDCDPVDRGCNGGFPERALRFIKQQGGIVSENSYPYKAKTGKKCLFQKDNIVISDSGAAVLQGQSEDKLKRLVARFGPVAVLINADVFLFPYYKFGVYVDPACGNQPETFNHAVLVVGYGTDPIEGDYWLVKNSWGEDWGEKGYIRMARNHNNMCGIATAPVIPTF